LLVIPAKAGIQFFQQIEEELDPSLRWDDGKKRRQDDRVAGLRWAQRKRFS